MASAMIERAEFPVHRNKTLYGPCIKPFGRLLAAARWSAASWLLSGRLHGANECAQDFAVDLRSHGVDINAAIAEEFAGIFGAINASRLNLNLVETRLRQLAAVILLFERARHAAYPGEHTPANFGQDFAPRHHIGDGKTPSGL